MPDKEREEKREEREEKREEKKESPREESLKCTCSVGYRDTQCKKHHSIL